ncbi:MAG TPA: helix-turn-helix domain-containing protein [Thermoanaerobaculia bacterium]|nr:helix-turn-helix domain-containing protein [Thermoanaerobaculia bacterium]
MVREGRHGETLQAFRSVPGGERRGRRKFAGRGCYPPAIAQTPNPAPSPSLDGEQLRYILGLKLKTLRKERGRPLKAIAARSGLSVSYLSEIEKGKKYPKPGKLIELARALDVPFDSLVTLQVGEELDPVKAVFSSSLLREFPFDLFGVEPQDLFDLVTQDPTKAGALLRTFLEVGRIYDVHAEHFLLAALRSYQQMHANYFEELEDAAASLRRARGWSGRTPPSFSRLRAVLERDYGYELDVETLPADPDLKSLRSVFRDGPRPRLLVNGRLMPSQKAFVAAREIGYRVLGLKERPATSTWIKVESFEQVLNNFKASYFAGALLIGRDVLREDLARFFARPKWDGAALADGMRRYDATPETFFYRLTQLVPRFFGLREIFFMRFSQSPRTGGPALTKVFNLSRVPVPHGVGSAETYCRRWPVLRLLHDMSRRGKRRGGPAVMAQRSRFLDTGAEFFVIAMARPLALTDGASSSVSLGFLLDDALREKIRFWDDPAVPRSDVNLTCERCRLVPSECHDRAAPPVLHDRQQQQSRKEEALRRLLATL